MHLQFPAYYCKESLIDVVLPLNEVKTADSKQWLIIGYPGVDGIEFRVKKYETDTAVYAYYPIDGEHIRVADTVEELIKKWQEGKIKL